MAKKEKPVFARNIVMRRRALGYKTALEFAEAVGLPYATIRDIEAGISEGHKETRDALVKTLRCTIADLYQDSKTSSDPSLAFASRVLSQLELLRPEHKAICLFLIFRDEKYLKIVPKEAARGFQALLKAL